MLVGDLILDEPDPDAFFEPSSSILPQANLLVGHVEVPYTRRGRETDVPAPPGNREKDLAALKRAGFHIATLAGNHISDAALMASKSIGRIGHCSTGADESRRSA